MREAAVTIPSLAKQAPIGIPDVEDIRTYELQVPRGKDVVAGRLPAPGSIDERTQADCIWLWVQAEVMERPK